MKLVHKEDIYLGVVIFVSGVAFASIFGFCEMAGRTLFRMLVSGSC